MRGEDWYMDYGDGYEFVRTGDGAIAHHRLLAYAWDILDDLDDNREVDHQKPVRWLNVQWNLKAENGIDHGHITRVREKARRQGQIQLALNGFPI